MKSPRTLMLVAGALALISPSARALDLTLAPGSNIQAAIDQVSAAGGGVVWLNAGTWTINTTLKMKSNVKIDGAGSGSTILQGPSSNYTFPIFDKNAERQVRMEWRDFRINGRNNTQSVNGMTPTANTGAEFDYTTIQNMEILGVSANAIGMSGHKHFTISNNYVHDNGRAALLHNVYCRRLVDGLTVINNRIQNSPSGCGAKFSGGSNWTIKGNTFTGNYITGFAIQDLPSNVLIQSNTMSANKGAGTNIGATNCTIDGNTANNNTGTTASGEKGYGIWTSGGNGTIKNNRASGNAANNFEFHGTWSQSNNL